MDVLFDQERRKDRTGVAGMEMQRRVGPIIYSSPCDNLSVLVVKDANHENFAAHEDPNDLLSLPRRGDVPLGQLWPLGH